MTLELLVIILGSLFWLAIGYGVGFEQGWRDGRRETWREILEDSRAQREAQALAQPLACPVCGAGRSNQEVAQGWCANCGVYHDG